MKKLFSIGRFYNYYRSIKKFKFFVIAFICFLIVFSTIPSQSQSTDSSPRQELIREIKEYAKRHLENDNPLATETVVNVLYPDNEAGMSRGEIGKIYEIEYIKLKRKQDANIWNKIQREIFYVLSWFPAFLMLILFIFRDLVVEIFNNLVHIIYTFIWNYLNNISQANRFFRRNSIKKYRQKLIDDYRRNQISYLDNFVLNVEDIFVPLKIYNNQDFDDKFDHDQNEEKVTIEEVIGKYNHTVVIGLPGSGKSLFIANALAFSNSPNAASFLATRYFQPEVKEALIKMGDVAIEELVKLAEKDSESDSALAALGEINQVVDFLWNVSSNINIKAAWRLGVLLKEISVKEILQIYPITNQQRLEGFYWVWKPFDELKKSSLSIIAGRIAFLIAKSKVEDIPKQELKLDARLVIPLYSIKSLGIIKEVRNYLLNSLDDEMKDDLSERLKSSKRDIFINDWLNIFKPLEYTFDTSLENIIICIIFTFFGILCLWSLSSLKNYLILWGIKFDIFGLFLLLLISGFFYIGCVVAIYQSVREIIFSYKGVFYKDIYNLSPTILFFLFLWDVYNFWHSKIVKSQIPFISQYPIHTIVISLFLFICSYISLFYRGRKRIEKAKNPLQGII